MSSDIQDNVLLLVFRIFLKQHSCIVNEVSSQRVCKSAQNKSLLVNSNNKPQGLSSMLFREDNECE